MSAFAPRQVLGGREAEMAAGWSFRADRDAASGAFPPAMGSPTPSPTANRPAMKRAPVLSLRQLRRRLDRREHACALPDCRRIVRQVSRHDGPVGDGGAASTKTMSSG